MKGKKVKEVIVQVKLPEEYAGELRQWGLINDRVYSREASARLKESLDADRKKLKLLGGAQ